MEEGWFYPLNYMIADWAFQCEGVARLAMKAENRPEQGAWTQIDGQPVYGIIGVQTDTEPLMPYIDYSLVEGDLLREDGTCLISEELLQRPEVNIGDFVEIRGVRMRIVGSFGSKILDVMDMDGESILPHYQINLTPEARREVLKAVTCEPQTVVITTLNTAVQIRYVFVSRICAVLEHGVDADALAKSMALSREYRFWASSGGEVHLAYMGSTFGGKGMPILIPWGIVILNVVATMMNAMHERRGEIKILSSIGLNPAHISGIFLAEASIIGVVGGGVGYLIGLGLYPLMTELSWAPIVQQKVSAVWVLAALGVAVAAVFFGSAIALRRSVVVTPSLKRRWTMEGIPEGHDKPWTTRMPVKIEEGRLEDFTSFVTDSLQRQCNPLLTPSIDSLKAKVEERDGERIHSIAFNYSEEQTNLRGLKTFNVLTIAKSPRDVNYFVELQSRGTREATYKTGSFIRKIIMVWNTERQG